MPGRVRPRLARSTPLTHLFGLTMLHGKVALVTGSSRGIGAGAAQRLARFLVSDASGSITLKNNRSRVTGRREPEMIK